MFHDFFLYRSNEPLWVAALENAEDLPERPPFMSIPVFVHLLCISKMGYRTVASYHV